MSQPVSPAITPGLPSGPTVGYGGVSEAYPRRVNSPTCILIIYSSDDPHNIISLWRRYCRIQLGDSNSAKCSGEQLNSALGTILTASFDWKCIPVRVNVPVFYCYVNLERWRLSGIQDVQQAIVETEPVSRRFVKERNIGTNPRPLILFRGLPYQSSDHYQPGSDYHEQEGSEGGYKAIVMFENLHASLKGLICKGPKTYFISGVIIFVFVGIGALIAAGGGDVRGCL